MALMSRVKIAGRGAKVRFEPRVTKIARVLRCSCIRPVPALSGPVACHKAVMGALAGPVGKRACALYRSDNRLAQSSHLKWPAGCRRATAAKCCAYFKIRQQDTMLTFSVRHGALLTTEN